MNENDHGKKYLVLVLIIIMTAAVFRLWQLTTLPPGLYPDEAINGNDAFLSLHRDQFRIFYPDNLGREGLFIWLISLSFKLFGHHVWALRLPSAILGIMTVAGLYLMSRELFDQKIALLSSFFLSVSFWHTNFSRIGFRAILVPFFLVFSFYLLCAASRKNNRLIYLMAGIFFGLGLYSYIAFRGAFLILAVVALLKVREKLDDGREQKAVIIKRLIGLFNKNTLRDLAVFLFALAAVSLPIGRYFITHPHVFMSRASTISVFHEDNPLQELTNSTARTLGMFMFSGDRNWRHNYSGVPLLAWTLWVFFVIGLAVSLVNCVRWFRKSTAVKMTIGKAMDSRAFIRPESPYIVLVCWFVIMLLPAMLTAQGIPHALRSIGVVPVVYVFCGLGLNLAVTILRRTARRLSFALLVFVILMTGYTNFQKYFLKWAFQPAVSDAFRQDLVNISLFLETLTGQGDKYVVANVKGLPAPYPNGLPMPAQTVMFFVMPGCMLAPESCAVFLRPEQLEEIVIKLHRTNVFVLMKDDEEVIRFLQGMLPDGRIRTISGFTCYVYRPGKFVPPPFRTNLP